jgi:protein OS-9
MTMTDTILFVKETKTCSYVLVINTPRLCGEPGFKSRLDQREETPVRCRQVVDAAGLSATDPSLPEADSPIHILRPKPILSQREVHDAPADTYPDDDINAATESLSGAIQQALQKMLVDAGLWGDEIPGTVVVEDAGDGEIFVEFMSNLDLDGADLALDLEYDIPETEDGEPVLPDAERVADALRAAGYDVRGQKPAAKAKRGEDKGAEEGRAKNKQRIAWPGQGLRVEL